MKSFSKFRKIALGVGAFTGVASIYYWGTGLKEAYASWTTHYEPNIHIKWDENWDHRSPRSLLRPKREIKEQDENKINEALEKYKSKAARHIILIRHGHYETSGKTDEERVLTELGRVQAEYTAKRLKELDLPYTEIVKSTMHRAQETGSIISQYLTKVPVFDCSLIREGEPVPPEPPIGSWKPEKHQFYIDGARIEAGFRKYFHRADPKEVFDSYTVLVCHANVIRYFVCRALQIPAEAWLRMSINHASITWITITPSGRVVLRNLGDSGHMPPNAITFHS